MREPPHLSPAPVTRRSAALRPSLTPDTDTLRDPVSELANRILFLDRVAQGLRRSGRPPRRPVAVLSLTVDQFATIEMSLGYDTAHQVLTEFGHRLTASVRNVDSVARVSGPEFAILIESLRDESDAARVAQRVHEALRAPIVTKDGDFMVSASVGVMVAAESGDPAQLLQLAGLARDRARITGAAYELYDAAMHQKAQDRLRREMDLRRGIAADEFEMHYQPIVAVATGRIEKLEALVRWRHPSRGLLAAAEFITLAEQTGLDIALGWTVLERACRQVRDWRVTLGGLSVPVSVNITAAHLMHRELRERLAAIVRELQLPPGSVNLEITEGNLIPDPCEARAILTDLRAMGIGVHLDDFGTGYSSLSYLHELPLDVIKIDRSFIAKSCDGPRPASVAATVRELARRIGVPVIAEGIETAAHLEKVRELQCEFAQGFLFARPLPPGEIANLLRKNGTLPSG